MPPENKIRKEDAGERIADLDEQERSCREAFNGLVEEREVQVAGEERECDKERYFFDRESLPT